MDHVIIDTLHLFLRISDILIENVIQELKKADGIEKGDVFHAGFDATKHPHMKAYMKFLNSLNIPFTWSINKDTKNCNIMILQDLKNY